MAHEVRGVIAGAKGADVTVTTIVVPDPGPGEALVKVQACGVCHSDMFTKDGLWPGIEYPRVPGRSEEHTSELQSPC